MTPTPIDGSTIFNLSLADAKITQGNGSLSVTYHYTQIDADAGINAIPQPYVNTNPNLFINSIALAMQFNHCVFTFKNNFGFDMTFYN